jgi:transitional endoplasmic reticulum ATPase
MAEAKKKETYQNAEIRREGQIIVLPEKMSYDDAIEWLTRKKKEEERAVDVRYEVKDALPLEGAYAFQQALERVFGWTDFKKPGFFESGPTALSLEVGFGKTEKVVWGSFQVPGLDGFLSTGYGQNTAAELPFFVIEGQVKKKHEELVKQVAELTKKIIAEESIYRGKAISFVFSEKVNPVLHAPKFLDVSKVDPAQLIFPESIQKVVDHTLFAPLLHTQACREAKIPLKRGVLLEGPYGTGKTLTQSVTAKHATDNGWTYLYVEETKDLAKAMRFAARFQPAVISAEDIDRADKDGQRSDRMNTILNTIDGVEFKNCELITLLTTNHVEKISKAMLRPGRLDAVIPVRPPDALAVGRLIRLYAGKLILPEEPLGRVGTRLTGQIPAVVREVVERAKLAAVARTGSASFLLTGADLETAADGMLEHLRLMEERKVDERPDRIKAAEMIAVSRVEAAQVLVAGLRPTSGEAITPEEVAALAGSLSDQ